MCCGNSRSQSRSQQATQKQVAEIPKQTLRQSDSGNPVNRTPVVQNTRNIERANEVNRNSFHKKHFQ